MEILEKIPVSLELGKIEKRLHIEIRDRWAPDAIQPLIAAKIGYANCYIDSKSENTVIIEGIEFTSRVLRKNLDKVERVFPYVITIGNKLENRMKSCSDILEQFYLDCIGMQALASAYKFLEDHLKQRYRVDTLSYMSPGSLEDWPIQEQVLLFKLLGDVKDTIGVELNDSLVMIPGKSVSGIYFPREVRFYSCQLCARRGCMTRKASYDKKLATEYELAT